MGAAGEVLGVGPPPKTMAAPFDWHAHRTPRTPDGEIQEPPAEVVDYLEAVKSGDVDMLRSAIARGAHVDTHHRVRPLKWSGGKPAGACARGTSARVVLSGDRGRGEGNV